MKRKDCRELLINAWVTEGFDGEDSYPVCEYQFCPKRRWRLDLAWPAIKLGVEIDGFGFGHQSIRGLNQDNEKQNAATLLGWRILRYTTAQLNTEKKAMTAVWEIKELMSLRVS